MTTMTNTTHRASYTVPAVGEANVVKVADFRDATDHLFRICNVDYSAARPGSERTRWVEIARRVARELASMDCKRATKRDWDRRERALDQSASLIMKALGL